MLQLAHWMNAPIVVALSHAVASIQGLGQIVEEVRGEDVDFGVNVAQTDSRFPEQPDLFRDDGAPQPVAMAPEPDLVA